jgi:hypothetical protein
MFQVEGDGSLREQDPIYQGAKPGEFGDGAPTYIIQLNGDTPRQIEIDVYAIDYLIPQVRKGLDLLIGYLPPTQLRAYEPTYMLLWIESPPPAYLQQQMDAPALPWPSDLPSLSSLYEHGNQQTDIWPAEGRGLPAVTLVEQEVASRISRLFDSMLAGKVFTFDETSWFVLPRPILPHENGRDMHGWPTPRQFHPSFECGP